MNITIRPETTADIDAISAVTEAAYYKRFGFKHFPKLTHKGIPPKYVLALPFSKTVPRGIVTFHEAFTATG